LLVGTLLALLLGAQPARAEPDSSRSTVAQALFEEGRRLMEAGEYGEACPKFKESYAADPAAGTVLNLALCYERQGKLALSWSTFKTAETVARRAGQKEREEFAHSHAAALEGRLARLTVTVSAAARVPGLVVTLDDVELGQAAWGIAMPVDPGTHRLRAEAPGKRPFELLVDVRGPAGTRKAVEVPELSEQQPTQPSAASQHQAPGASSAAGAEAPGATSSQAPTPASGTKSSVRPTVGWVAVGVGVAGIGVGTWFGFHALSLWHDRNRACSGGCTVAAKQAGDDANRAATVADIAIGAGLAATAVGIYLVLTGRPRTAEQRSESHALRISPALGSNHTGLSVSSTW
jgi:hypothetical protein